MGLYSRVDTRNDYAPFKRTASSGYRYDLRLEKDGVIANIINNTIVSFDGTDKPKIASSLTKHLAKFGFVLPQ